MNRRARQMLEWALGRLREAQEASMTGSFTVQMVDGEIQKIERHEHERPPAGLTPPGNGATVHQ